MTDTPVSPGSELPELPFATSAIMADVEDAVLNRVTAELNKVMDRHGILALAAHELRQAVIKGVESGVDECSQKLREKQGMEIQADAQ